MKHRVPPEEAFVVTVGVPRAQRQIHCARALTVLRQAGFTAGATSNEAVLALADEVHRIHAQENDTE